MQGRTQGNRLSRNVGAPTQTGSCTAPACEVPSLIVAAGQGADNTKPPVALAVVREPCAGPRGLQGPLALQVEFPEPSLRRAVEFRLRSSDPASVFTERRLVLLPIRGQPPEAATCSIGLAGDCGPIGHGDGRAGTGPDKHGCRRAVSHWKCVAIELVAVAAIDETFRAVSGCHELRGPVPPQPTGNAAVDRIVAVVTCQLHHRAKRRSAGTGRQATRSDERSVLFDAPLPILFAFAGWT